MHGMRLEDIGFYTLSDERARGVSASSPLQRCELILTSQCNFKCLYCRGMKNKDKGDISLNDAKQIVKMWASHKLQNIRFSGGEPTLWKGLNNLIYFTKKLGIKRIALSTNGSASIEKYTHLANLGVNDFSISLDSCCSSTGNKMAGGVPIFNKVIDNIRKLSQISYTTVGVVLTEENEQELNKIIKLASTLGVSDIRIIPAAQVSKRQIGKVIKNNTSKYPILKYRINNFFLGKNVRGLSKDDNNQCPLVLDDMTILNRKHYPCIIYMREWGAPIGTVNKNMETIREERKKWFMEHNTFEDNICRNNCLDVCTDYNNKVKVSNSILYK